MGEQIALQEPVKDEHSAHPVASVWRPVFREVVKHFVQGNYTLVGGPSAVEPVSASTAKQIRRYVAAYGETLAELPEDTWRTSVAQWMLTEWDVLVDLWTVESGQSDMVLSAGVFETKNGFRFEIRSVHVP